MEKKIKNFFSAILVSLLIVCLISCNNTEDQQDLWQDAIYQSDTEFGTGSITVYVEVKAGEKSITFTLNTDKNILGDALLEHNLIDGEESQYGLYIKSVNGIIADYDIDQTYWGFYKNGEYMMTGIDSTEIKSGEHYELVRTK